MVRESTAVKGIREYEGRRARPIGAKIGHERGI
jgi:hypothetical protein